MFAQPALQAAEAALRGSTGRYNHALEQLEARQKELDAAQNIYTPCDSYPTSSKTGYSSDAGSEAHSALRKAQQAVDAMLGLLEVYGAEVREARAAVRKLKGQGMAAGPSRPWDRACPREQSEEDKMRQRREQAREQRRKEEARARQQKGAEERKRRKEAEEMKRRKEAEARRQQEQEQRRKDEREAENRRRFFEWRAKYYAHLNPKPTTNDTTYISWKRSVDAAFADYASINIFPAPPVSNLCTKPACVAGKKLRILEACPCDIRRAFEILRIDVKSERLKWHPDRFSKCAEEKREEFQEMAKEVFQVLAAMHAES